MQGNQFETRHPSGTTTVPAPRDTLCEQCYPPREPSPALAVFTVTSEVYPIHVCRECFREVETTLPVLCAAQGRRRAALPHMRTWLQRRPSRRRG